MGCDISAGGISHVYVEGGGVKTWRVILEMWRDDMTGCDVLRGGVTGTGHNMYIITDITEIPVEKSCYMVFHLLLIFRAKCLC